MELPAIGSGRNATPLDRFIDEAGWLAPAEGCAFAPGNRSRPESAGSLVFDVDGVLVDTRRSFDEVIPRSVEFYRNEVLGLQGQTPWMADSDAALWRRAGGFNNDWDTAEAGLLYALWRDSAASADAPVPSVNELADETAAAGGGPAALRAIISRRAGPLATGIFARVDRPLLDRIFKELYVGAPLFPRVFGEPARHWDGRGAVENERSLLSPDLRDRALALPVGILTGRIPEEASLALELTGLTGLDPELVVTDDGRFAPKPDPAGLLYLADRLGSRPLYYFGDNPDDLAAWQQAREATGDEGLHFICCLGDDADLELIRRFAGRGTTLIAAGVGQALEEVLP